MTCTVHSPIYVWLKCLAQGQPSYSSGGMQSKMLQERVVLLEEYNLDRPEVIELHPRRDLQEYQPIEEHSINHLAQEVPRGVRVVPELQMKNLKLD